MKRKTTAYLRDQVLMAMRRRRSRWKRDSQSIEDAIWASLGFELLKRVGTRAGLTEEDALALAYREVHQA